MYFVVVVVVVVVVPVENCCKIQRRAYARLDLLEEEFFVFIWASIHSLITINKYKYKFPSSARLEIEVVDWIEYSKQKRLEKTVRMVVSRLEDRNGIK